jgi:hypothetical protein
VRLPFCCCAASGNAQSRLAWLSAIVRRNYSLGKWHCAGANVGSNQAPFCTMVWFFCAM